MPVTLAPRRLKQEDDKFKASLGSIAISCLKIIIIIIIMATSDQSHRQIKEEDRRLGTSHDTSLRLLLRPSNHVDDAVPTERV
jgi:hypothetical protein